MSSHTEALAWQRTLHLDKVKRVERELCRMAERTFGCKVELIGSTGDGFAFRLGQCGRIEILTHDELEP